MSRVSRFEHLKREVLQHFQEGMTLNEVLQQYPDVPRQTVRDWHRSFCADSVHSVPNSGSQSQQGFQPKLVKTSPQAGDEGEPDDRRANRELSRIRKALWDVVRNPAAEGSAIRVQALNACLKCLEVEKRLPAEDDAGATTINIAADVRSMSTEELERLAAGR
ncbi:hypothetical protein H6F43_03255 [Leptolyngbya sp. FACHB-36]|uniref:hypothetical protein n=1 Tax=Leptolyngbya sp. FACHB-36 TaxID=2692808 RepID=UPI0016813FBE|nr:hypothetical protein [Leptolyngbya sp. FACHB-36]MBD2019201.1 hypothetical protein [Leptolyngbya sp. FACHB-36]